jgi:ATP/maltotriose-dependent transcriptional regulator MalT
MEVGARDATTAGLLEREAELAALERLIDDAEDGRGRVVLIEGPAGIGKTRLLAEARERAARRMTVLSARCGELERDLSFGAVRQLFEAAVRDPERRERLMAGAAAAAEGVLEAPGGEGAAEGSFAVLHGLYWVTLNLAEERPVLLAIDDLQWSDRPSLRFLAYLVRRLEGAPVLVAATLRTTDPGTDPSLLAELAADPLTESLRPAPLGTDAIAELARARLGADADPGFAAACQEATGGNPLLLLQLLSALDEDGIRPAAAGAEAVREIGARAVSRTVLVRLARLSPDAVSVARAVAVLGESSRLPVVAALTGLDEEAVVRATGELAGADILRPEPPLGFVHPLVRDAVYGDVPPGEHELQHGRAARALADAHGSDEEIAVQLLHAPRRGDALTVERLRASAAGALRRGGPESAVAYLARALEEPPPPDAETDVLLELGLVESGMNALSATAHLREAHDRLDDPAAKASAALALAQSLLFVGRAADGLELARRTADEMPPELADMRQAIEAVELIAAFFGAGRSETLSRLEQYRQVTPSEGIGSRMMMAAAAFAWAAGGGPAPQCEALGLASLADGALLRSGEGLFWSSALAALILSDSPSAPDYMAAAREEAYRHGSIFTVSSAEMFTGTYLLGTGDLEEAEELLRHSVELQDPWGSDTTGSSWARGLLARCLFLRGDRAGALARRGEAPRPEDESDGANLWRWAQAEMLLADGSAQEALEVGELMGRTAPHSTHPDWKPWQSLRGRALAMLDRREEAVESIEAELELARGTGTAPAIGRCLRQLGEVDPKAGMERLTEAVDVLSGSSARLEHARALAALGGAIRRDRNPSRAREPLHQALELAEACACGPLVEAVRSELYAAGARPRAAAVGGVESLTARERRVAELAADGRTNREIAQGLFVTPKTVEVHLSSAYRKLSIRSRRELPAALAT